MKIWVVRPFGILEGVGERAADVGQDPWFVGQRPAPPGLRDGGFAVDPELRPGRRADPEDGHVVVIAVADEIVETIYAEGRPLPPHLHPDDPFRGLEPDARDLRRLAPHLRMIGLQEDVPLSRRSGCHAPQDRRGAGAQT